MARIHDDEAEQIREVLRPYLNRRVEVEGTVTEIGTVNDHHTRRDVASVCLNNVEVRTSLVTHNPVIQHVWCSWALTMINAGVMPGDTVRFTAQVYQYVHQDRKSGKQMTRFAIREPRDVRCLNRKLEPLTDDDGFDEAPAERRERVLRGGVGDGPATLAFPVMTAPPAPFKPAAPPPVKPIEVRTNGVTNGVPAAPVLNGTPPAEPARPAEPAPAPVVTEEFKAAADVEAATPIRTPDKPDPPAAEPRADRKELFTALYSLCELHGIEAVKKVLKAVDAVID